MAIFFNLILIPVWPFASSDLFTYIFQARILSKYQLSPYLFTYVNFPQDAFFWALKNRYIYTTSVYGPIFILVSTLLTYLGGDNLFLTIYLFKILFLFVNVFNSVLIFKITKSEIATFLYSWNPLVLFEFGVNSHNEVIMISFVLLSFLFLFKKTNVINYILSIIFYLFSILTKYITLVILPFYFFYYANEFSKQGKLLKYLSTFVVIGLVMFIFIYLIQPYWFEVFIKIFKPFHYQGVMFTSSLGIIVISFTLFLFGVGNYYGWGLVLSKFLFFIICFFLFAKILMKKDLKTRGRLLDYSVLVIGIFLLMYFDWWFSWYLTTFIALLSLYIGVVKKFQYRLYIYLTTFYGIIFYLLYK